MNAIDQLLNKITMYRLVLSSLAILAAISLVLAFFGMLPFSAIDLAISFVILIFTARIVNGACALFFKASPTPESAYITGLILFFILSPIQNAHDALILILAATIAMLSKYLLVLRKQHIFNPAALSAFILTLCGSAAASWWVATPVLLPFVIVVGLLIVRKIRRFDLFCSFFVTAIFVFIVHAELSSTDTALFTTLIQFLISWPLIFLGTIMLTEPQTMPTSHIDRIIYGTLVGFLFSISFTLGPLTATPEFALIVGNMYALAVSNRRRITLTLHSITQLAHDTYEYAFIPNNPISFAPGQYMEWTTPHEKVDKRGIRRYFTIASAPGDTYIRAGMKLPVEGSSFKRRLRSMKIGTAISAVNITGHFTMPKDPNEPIAAIAGGIGITPFMSMFRYLHSRGEHRDIVLIYCAPTPLDFAYREEIDSYKDTIGLRVIYLPTDFEEMVGWKGASGFVTDTLIKREIKDFSKRHWYLSGPSAMVDAYKKLIRTLGTPDNKIKTDYFPGF